MNNPETLATFGAKDTTRTKTTKTQKMRSNTDPTKKPGVNPGAREGQAVPASY